jgi:putative membrane protein
MPVWIPYCGPGATPSDWALRWNLDPAVLVLLALATGLAAMRLQGSRRVAALAAVGVLAVIFISPLCALSSALFSARTAHHLLLVAVAAPLVAHAWAPRGTGSLALATLTQAVIFWAWHTPTAYAAALSHDAVYWAMQASLLASAVWFWACLRIAPVLASVAALLAAMMAMGLLGALITFAPTALYAPHFATTLAWGMNPLEDQQAAGLIMWAPAAAFYLAAALVRLGRRLGPDTPRAAVA